MCICICARTCICCTIPYDSKKVCYMCTCNWICICLCLCTCSCISMCICICTCIRLLLLNDSYHKIQEHYRCHHNNYCSYHVARSTHAQKVSAIPSSEGREVPFRTSRPALKRVHWHKQAEQPRNGGARSSIVGQGSIRRRLRSAASRRNHWNSRDCGYGRGCHHCVSLPGEAPTFVVAY